MIGGLATLLYQYRGIAPEESHEKRFWGTWVLPSQLSDQLLISAQVRIPGSWDRVLPLGFAVSMETTYDSLSLSLSPSALVSLSPALSLLKNKNASKEGNGCDLHKTAEA